MKVPVFNKEQIQEIIKKYPTPFHLYDEKGIRETARALNDAFSWNEGYKEYFAVKALPNPTILKILKEEGCGVDCASETELMLAEALGFTGEEIMFSSNVTPAKEYVYARKLDAIINLDDYSHIDFLKENGGIPETICLRYNPGGDFQIGTSIMGSPWDAKYGMTKTQLMAGIRKLSAMGAKKFGIHAFLSSNTTDKNYYPYLAKELFTLAVEMNKLTGAEISFINLSGGIGIPYRPEDRPVDIKEVGEGVRKMYERTIAKAGMKVAIKTELGRFMTGPHGYLVSTVLHEKKIYKDYIGLDACAVNLMRPAMYGAYHHITVMGKEDAPHDTLYDVTGSLCENNDKFAVNRALPKIDIGDIVVIHDTGAHGFSMGYNYNGKLRSAEVLLKEDGSTQLIRRAETPKDYFATLDFTDTF
ncbi:MAG: diaminopimelate decarboxylase [Clostridiales bacterium]|nr:diaminopimelate decarboxylase [Clostridiales bacterium]